MRFKSRKDTLFRLVIFGVIALLIAAAILGFRYNNESFAAYVVLMLMLLLIKLLIWLYFGTYYDLTEDHLRYRNGPFRGKIDLGRINGVVLGKTLWVGHRPATARKGLIIKYDKFDEIYISPESNELFVRKLLEFKPDVKVSE